MRLKVNRIMNLIKKLLIGTGLGVVYSIAIAAPNCEVTIESNDQVSWDTPTITISKACKNFTVILTHTGQLNKDIMGHNWVLTKQQDMEAVAKSVVTEKLTDFINKEDPRIIAYTPMISGGEKTTVELDVSKLEIGQKYTYFCSYPEHSDLMNGLLEVVD